MNIDDLLRIAIEDARASDLHLKVGNPSPYTPWIGDLTP